MRTFAHFQIEIFVPRDQLSPLSAPPMTQSPNTYFSLSPQSSAPKLFQRT